MNKKLKENSKNKKVKHLFNCSCSTCCTEGQSTCRGSPGLRSFSGSCTSNIVAYRWKLQKRDPDLCSSKSRGTTVVPTACRNSQPSWSHLAPHLGYSRRIEADKSDHMEAENPNMRSSCCIPNKLACLLRSIHESILQWFRRNKDTNNNFAFHGYWPTELLIDKNSTWLHKIQKAKLKEPMKGRQLEDLSGSPWLATK